MSKRKHYGAAKHDTAKTHRAAVGLWRDRVPSAAKKVALHAYVWREAGQSGAGHYVATVCVRAGKHCGIARAAQSPTAAIKKALTALGRKLK